jgi:hypothetical protein
MKHKTLKCFHIKTLCIEFIITGKINKLIGLVTEADVRRVQDIQSRA